MRETLLPKVQTAATAEMEATAETKATAETAATAGTPVTAEIAAIEGTAVPAADSPLRSMIPVTEAILIQTTAARAVPEVQGIPVLLPPLLQM